MNFRAVLPDGGGGGGGTRFGNAGSLPEFGTDWAAGGLGAAGGSSGRVTVTMVIVTFFRALFQTAENRIARGLGIRKRTSSSTLTETKFLWFRFIRLGTVSSVWVNARGETDSCRARGLRTGVPIPLDEILAHVV